MSAENKGLYLLPEPRRIELTGGEVKLPERPLFYRRDDLALADQRIIELIPDPESEGDLSVQRDGSLAPEEYILIIDGKSSVPVTIRAATRLAGLHALRTLKAIRRQSGHSIPAMVVEDKPAFEQRGVMLDVSRNRVPKMDELLRIIRLLGGWKINHLQLYTEHTFAYRGHSEVWRGASPLTAEQIQRLDRECRFNGITLAANQNCFGHMERWLRHPRYARLAETDAAWEWEGILHPGRFSLCPLDPGSIELVEDLLCQLLPNFTSRLVNVGCDETLDVGQGRSRSEIEARGSAAVYFDFVSKVSEAVRREGFRPMFWADIALSHPSELSRIPVGMICLVWGYEPDAPFEEWCDRLARTGNEVWVCPGTSSWRSITGRTFERQENLRAAVEQGLAGGARGLMVTDWGDEGHRQQWPVSLMGLAEAAGMAWSGKAVITPENSIDANLREKGEFRISGWLRRLGDVDLAMRSIYGRTGPGGAPTRLRNSSALYLEMQHPERIPPAGFDPYGEWRDVLQRINELEASLPTATPQIESELALTVLTARFAALLALHRIAPHREPRLTQGLPQMLGEIIGEHRRIWRLRSRPGGLRESTSWYKGILARLKGKEKHAGG